MEDVMTTIKDVAKLAGVAVSTASYALNNSSKVTPETTRKIIEAAKTLNYRRNGIARDLKLNKTETIGLILNDLSGSFWSEVIRGVQETLTANDYGLIACSSIEGKTSTVTKFLQERRVDGVIMLASNISDEMINQSVRDDFPIVLLDREPADQKIMSVLVDNERGGYEATDHLIKLGHREIAFMSGPQENRDNAERFLGFQRSMMEHNLALKSHWTLQGKFTREGGYLSAKMLILQGNIPTAIFCANDEMAIGALRAFKEANLKIPEDVSIVGFDDIEISQYVHPPLTTVSQSKFEIGSLAAHLVCQSLTEEVNKRNFIMPTELVVRKTTGVPRKSLIAH